MKNNENQNQIIHYFNRSFIHAYQAHPPYVNCNSSKFLFNSSLFPPFLHLDSTTFVAINSFTIRIFSASIRARGTTGEGAAGDGVVEVIVVPSDEVVVVVVATGGGGAVAVRCEMPVM
jgi:hypothetical protein